MTKKIDLPYKLLTYDIETPLYLGYFFGLGEQILRHTQFLERSVFQSGIICIAAKWYHKKEVMLFTGNTAIEDLDRESKKADVCLGKNSDKFDVKRINSERMLHDLTPYPQWMDKREDLEKQMRKYFYFPSQSLDYISKRLGLGGKIKMEFDDWKDIYNYNLLKEIEDQMSLNCLSSTEIKFAAISISEVMFKQPARQTIALGKAALKKMYFYNKKDVLDTEAALIKVLPHVKLKFNASVTKDKGYGCTICGSSNIHSTGVITVGKTKYQTFDCTNHGGYAGRATWHYVKGSHNKTYGKMG